MCERDCEVVMKDSTRKKLTANEEEKTKVVVILQILPGSASAFQFNELLLPQLSSRKRMSFTKIRESETPGILSDVRCYFFYFLWLRPVECDVSGFLLSHIISVDVMRLRNSV